MHFEIELYQLNVLMVTNDGHIGVCTCFLCSSICLLQLYYSSYQSTYRRHYQDLHKMPSPHRKPKEPHRKPKKCTGNVALQSQAFYTPNTIHHQLRCEAQGAAAAGATQRPGDERGPPARQLCGWGGLEQLHTEGAEHAGNMSCVWMKSKKNEKGSPKNGPKTTHKLGDPHSPKRKA